MILLFILENLTKIKKKMNNLLAEDFYCQYKLCKLQLDKSICNGCIANDDFTSHSCYKSWGHGKELYKAEAIQTILSLYNIHLAESDFQMLRTWLDNRESTYPFVVTNKMLSDIFK